MKITALRTFFVKPRWVFLKVETDEDLCGWGEPVVEGWSRTTATAVETMGRYLVGKDPRLIEHHWQALYRGGFYRGGPILCSALSGIEQALWDITGKWYRTPVYNLLGGPVRRRVRVYAHVGGDDPEACARSGKTRVEQGFTALKICPFPAAEFIETPAYVEQATARIAALREAVGASVDIAVDCHGRLSPALAIRVARALEPYDILFLEEPCLPENVDAMVGIARSTSIPIATGERLYTKWGFREVLEKGAARVLQPDVSHAGGILEVRKIAAMAEAWYAAIAPHCPLGPIALAACLQVDACTPNFLCQEQATLGDGYLRTPFVVRDGYVDIPEKPGLGIEVDEEAIADRLYDGSWETPRLEHEDGSVADW